jgi:hypothetical protein
MGGAAGPIELMFEPHVGQAIGVLLVALIPAFARTVAVALALGPPGRRR